MRLIDADALIDNKLERMIESFGIDFSRVDVAFGLHDIENAPTVEAEPIRHGRWKIIDQDVMGCKKYRCELCGAVIEAYSLDNIRYCGGCGAKMDEEAEE